MVISAEDLAASLKETERRRREARERAKRQRARLVYACVGFLVLVAIVLAGLGLGARSAVRPPRLVLTWPVVANGPEVDTLQSVESGSTVLLRRGKPLTVGVQGPPVWQLTWSGDGVQTTGAQDQWDPAAEAATLTVSCQPRERGWRLFLDWLYPSPTLQLHGVAAKATTKFGLQLAPPASGAWVFPGIYASQPVSWDERLLPFLCQASGSLPTPNSVWMVVPSFNLTSAPAGDAGTYFMLTSPTAQDDMPRIARALCRLDPKASIKFIVRLDRKPVCGILRLAFDYKGSRGGWIRRTGGGPGDPIVWWNQVAPGTQFSPTLPPAGLLPQGRAVVVPTAAAAAKTTGAAILAKPAQPLGAGAHPQASPTPSALASHLT